MPSLVILSLALLLQGPSTPTLKYDMPEGWRSKPASSRMRVAEFVLPKVAPGSSERHNKPGFHLRAAVIEGKGPFFVRLAGPAKTIAKWDASVQAFFKSLRAE